MSSALYDPAATQTYTFRRFKYLFDFSGFDDLAQLVISDIEFQGDGKASGIMLAREGFACGSHARGLPGTKALVRRT